MLGCGRLLLCGFHSLCVDKRVFKYILLLFYWMKNIFIGFFFFSLDFIFYGSTFYYINNEMVFPLKLPLTLKIDG